MTKKLKLISGVLFFALMGANVGANFYGSWAEQIAYSQRGWEAKGAKGKPTVWTVDTDGPAAALRVGDEIVALKVEPQGACALINRRECVAPRGTAYKLSVRRGGETLEFELRTAAKPLSDLLYDFALYLASLIFLATGLIVFLLKPDNKQAWLLALMLGSFTGLITGGIRLAELTVALRTVTDLPQLLELVATRIQAALQTVNVAIFLRDQTTGNYNSAYSRDYSETDGRAIGRERHSDLGE